jgi:predicted transcriptional regulator
MRTNIRIVLERVNRGETTDETYRVREVIGSLYPKVDAYMAEHEVQGLIDNKRNVVVIRAAK